MVSIKLIPEERSKTVWWNLCHAKLKENDVPTIVFFLHWAFHHKLPQWEQYWHRLSFDKTVGSNYFRGYKGHICVIL